MNTDFDRVFERGATHAIKWDRSFRGDDLPWDETSLVHGDQRVLPMWVADMDFACAQPIVDAIKQRAMHPVFGYSEMTPGYSDAVCQWMADRHSWTVEPDWLVTTPGIVPALNTAVQANVTAGDKVLIQTPVYYPFFRAAAARGAEIVTNPLTYENGRYQMDFEDLEAKTADPKLKIALLCSPHNPVGRVWSADELRRFGEICLKNNVIVFADEIHHDIIFPGHKFVAYASLAKEFAEHSITGTSASKSFNLAGLQTANVLISNAALRNGFKTVMLDNGLMGMNPFGIVATETAYRGCAEWLDALVDYVWGNVTVVRDFLKAKVPTLDLVEPEGTYLLWIDCRETGLSGDDVHRQIMDEAKLFLNKGATFGPEGEGFERINVGCPRSVVEQALNRMQQTFG
jgi:cystathionine beta-lyase